ncbi:MAG: M48 family metallopeptidase [Gammaproteobacteria bacterium]|nr:M48 family metallopeptidase [Gammaproteobacteria bacterium]
MHWFKTLFLVLLVAGTILRVWLSWRQLQAMKTRRDHVPPPFDRSISIEDHKKASDYTAVGARLGILDIVIDAALLLAWTIGGGLQLLDGWISGFGYGPILTGVAVILGAFLIMSLLSLPLSLYRTFGVEARFGFNKTTPALYVADMLKGWLVGFLLATPLLALILWIMDAAGSYWWIYAWLVWVSFSLAITWAYPAFIAPLFNKFSELSDESLKQRIEALLQRCGFQSKGIFIMDGSRRSTHGNAYFTGVGNNKRIVFFDTLIDSLEPLEIEAVLAHELGHFRRKHIRSRLITGFVLGLVGLAVLGFLKEQSWFYTSLGVTQPSSYMALLLFMMVIPVFTFFITPISAYISRKHEFEADEYAHEQSDASALISALAKLYRDNASTLVPDEIHSRFYDSHPPGPVRVARLEKLLGS